MIVSFNTDVKQEGCFQCDNPFPYKCEECMDLVYEMAAIPKDKINIASGEDCYAGSLP
jgi:hypothetical protein